MATQAARMRQKMIHISAQQARLPEKLSLAWPRALALCNTKVGRANKRLDRTRSPRILQRLRHLGRRRLRPPPPRRRRQRHRRRAPACLEARALQLPDGPLHLGERGVDCRHRGLEGLQLLAQHLALRIQAAAAQSGKVRGVLQRLVSSLLAVVCGVGWMLGDKDGGAAHPHCTLPSLWRATHRQSAQDVESRRQVCCGPRLCLFGAVVEAGSHATRCSSRTQSSPLPAAAIR